MVKGDKARVAREAHWKGVPINERKPHWISKGDKREEVFRKRIAPKLGMKLIDGPRYGVDFIDEKTGAPVELKYRDKPFFMAERLLGMNASFTVPLNCSNLDRYTDDTLIVFWVNWPAEDKYGVKVAGQSGLYAVKRGDIPASDTRYRHHFYANRKPHVCGGRDEYGNNVCARYLDLRELERIDTSDMVLT